MLVKHKAIVIKSFSYGDTSLISRLILNDGNKMSLLIKGAKNIKSNKSALFQSCNLIHIDYYYKDSRDIQIYKEGHLIDGFMNLRKSFDSIKYGLCMIDIIDKTLPKYSNEEIMFNLLQDCLSKINNKDNSKIVLIYFLLLYSYYSGYNLTDLDYSSLKIDHSFMDKISQYNSIEYLKLEELILNNNHDIIIKEIIYLIGLNIDEIKNVKSLRFIN